MAKSDRIADPPPEDPVPEPGDLVIHLSGTGAPKLYTQPPKGGKASASR